MASSAFRLHLHKEYKKYAREFFNNHQSLIISQEDERRSLVIQCVKEIHEKLSKEVICSSWKKANLEYPQNPLMNAIQFSSQPSQIFERFIHEESSMIVEQDSELVGDDSMIIENENYF